MIRSESKYLGVFRICEISFADEPFEVSGYDAVVFRGCVRKVPMSGFESAMHTSAVIDLTMPLEKIWERLDKDTRRRIKIVEKQHDAEIRMDSDYDSFAYLFRKFNISKKLPLVELGNLKAESGHLLTGWYKGSIVLGAFYSDANERIVFTRGCSALPFTEGDDRVTIGNLNRLMHWKAMQIAKKEGYAQLDMGAAEADTKEAGGSISRFKLAFGGQLAPRYNYVKDYSPLLGIVRQVIKISTNTAHRLGMHNLPFKSLGKGYI
ncbi:MAG: hypothetical protein KGI04_04950 [Candidatus Micrarchaeota archaeon]|nr:hypothetical protein [Candidatus Micrarchaeota archaeon]